MGLCVGFISGAVPGIRSGHARLLGLCPSLHCSLLSYQTFKLCVAVALERS